MTKEFDPEFDAIRAALVSRPELTKDLNVSLRNVLRLTEHLKNSGLRMERHGRWMWDTGDVYTCTCCGEKSHVKEVMEEPDWGWCPNCGARMDGGDGT